MLDACDKIQSNVDTLHEEMQVLHTDYLERITSVVNAIGEDSQMEEEVPTITNSEMSRSSSCCQIILK